MLTYPGAHVDLLPRGNNPAPLVGRALYLHTNGGHSTSTARQLWAWIRRTPAAPRPHFQIDLDGKVTQGVPLDKRAACTRLADTFSWSVETADYGAATLGARGWSDAQVEALAALAAWLHHNNGLPLERLDKWDGAGIGGHCESEVLKDQRQIKYPNTTRARGKICPGAAKVGQLDLVIARAVEMAYPFAPDVRRWADWPDRAKPVLKDAASGDVVRYLTGVIRTLPSCGLLPVQGVWDAWTEAGVRLFQQAYGLVVDGWVGRQTWAAIDAHARKVAA
jgi:hypothetical protein